MSNQAPVPTPSAPQPPAPVAPPSPSLTTEQLANDALLRLAHHEIPAERRRLKAISNPNAAQCMNELHGTTLDIVQDLARNQVEVRDWVFEYMTTISQHMEALESRLETMDQFGTETVLTPEDADIIMKAVLGCGFIAKSLLQGPFPIQERDEEGKQKLAELLAYCEQAERIINDNRLVPEDEEDELETAEEADDAEPS